MSATICWTPEGTEPCPYCANCSELRQLVQLYAGKRGMACEFYVGFEGDRNQRAAGEAA